MRHHLRAHGVPTGAALADLCASFQEAVVHVLVKKALRAAEAEGVRDVVVAGGVAANSRLRAAFVDGAERRRLRVFPVPVRYCGDNAAMIAALGAVRLGRGDAGEFLELDADAGLRAGA